MTETKTTTAREVLNTDQQLGRLLAIARMTLRTVAARTNFSGSMQTGMISIQLSIVLLGGLHQQLEDRDELDRFDGETRDWLCFGGLLGVLDAEAWRMLSTEGDDGIAESDLADFEHGLRQLITHGESVLARLRDVEAVEEISHG